MNLQHARLLSVGVKQLVIVLALAMGLEHPKIGARTVQLAFRILFGGMCALALPVGARSKEVVTMSVEHEASKHLEEPEPFHHI